MTSTKSSQKFCPQCGAPNKRTAKVCVQCGHRFKATTLASAQPHESAAQLSEIEKSCPACGTVNKLAAKVCIQCGHRFSTRFEQNKASEPSAKISEPPVAQNPQPALTLPQAFELPSTPDLPSVSAPNILTGNSLEGEPAPDISSDELNRLREQSAENIPPYERLQRSLQRKQQKP